MEVVATQLWDSEVKNTQEGTMINRRNLLMGVPAVALMAHQAGRGQVRRHYTRDAILLTPRRIEGV